MKVVQPKQAKKPMLYASYSGFYVDCVITWDHKGNMVAKYVGHHTKNTIKLMVTKPCTKNTSNPCARYYKIDEYL